MHAVSFVFEIQRDNSLKVLSPLQASVTHKKFQKGGYILSRLIFPILPSSNPSQKFHVTCVKNCFIKAKMDNLKMSLKLSNIRLGTLNTVTIKSLKIRHVFKPPSLLKKKYGMIH